MPNRTFNFTKSAVENLVAPTTGQVIYRDTRVRGLGVRVGRSAKAFFAEGAVHGRTKRVTIGRTDIISVEEARKDARELLAKMARGVDPVSEKRELRARGKTLREAFSEFFEARPHLSPRTVEGYSRTRDLYLVDWAGRPVVEVTPSMVLARHKRITERNGAVTANNVFRHLRSVLNFAAASTQRPFDNPVQVLSQARAWHREIRRQGVITAADLPAWWAAVQRESEDGRDILMLALFTGMRRTEILSLRWEHLDLAGSRLTLPRTKNGDPLELPLPEVLHELLLDRASIVGQQEWVFPGCGRTGHITETKSFVARVAKRSAVAFGMHDLRRTFVTIAESLDISAYALKRLLNHRVSNDVTGGYIVMSVDRLRDPMDRIAGRILELADGRSTGVR